jgi:hypothetical protein
MVAPRAAPPPAVAGRIARQLLRLDGVEPRALFPLKGSLAISAIRCVLTYAIIPAAAPLISWLGVLARPLSIALSAVATVMAVVSLRRVWAADWTYRWAYTAFILVVLVLLAVVIAVDVNFLLG